MRWSTMTKLAGVIAALSAASVAYGGAPRVSCQNNSESAISMLKSIHDEAYEVRNNADLLETYNRFPFQTSWRFDAETLNNMRDEINQMDETLRQLRTMEGNLPRNEDAEIDQIAPAMAELTSSTQDAITYLNHDQFDLWKPQYIDKVRNMDEEAGRVERGSVTPGSTTLACGKVSQPMGAPGLGSGS